MKRNHPGCLKKTELRVCLRQLNEGESNKKKFLVKNKQYIQMQNFTLYFTWPIEFGVGLGCWTWIGSTGPGIGTRTWLDNIS